MTANPDLRAGVHPGAVIRRRPDTLFRSTADGYLLHTGDGVMALTGAEAELWDQIDDAVGVGELIDRQARAWGADRRQAAPPVLEILTRLQRTGTVEVVDR